MGQAKWYDLTPARQQLLGAFGVALVIAVALFVRCARVVDKLNEAGEQEPKQGALR
jgi:hypothetical protein